MLIIITERGGEDLADFAIIADDLSGACDTAVTFSNRGYKSFVLNYPEGCKYAHKSDVVAISTNTREASREVARQSIKGASKYLQALGVKEIYKKIDSTWRGNIGVEIETIMDVFDYKMAIVSSAYISAGRTVRNGTLLINETPLHETTFAIDPGFPVKHSFLPDILKMQTKINIELVNIEILRKGAKILAKHLNEIATKDKTIALVDAVNESDLETIVALKEYPLPSYLFCGSAGLANKLINTSQTTLMPKLPPVIVFVGSVQPQNRIMVDYLIKNNLAEEIYIDPLELLAGQTDYEVLFQIERIINGGKDLVIKTYRDEQDRKKVDIYAKENGINQAIAAVSVVEGLQKMVKPILQNKEISGMIVTGGTTFLHVLRGIEGVGINVEEEIEPGVPIGTILGGPYEGMGIITKAGSFGLEDTFARGIEILKRKYRHGRKTYG